MTDSNRSQWPVHDASAPPQVAQHCHACEQPPCRLSRAQSASTGRAANLSEKAAR
jgi:hypothetical protein